jgi:hypothetical protein
MCGYWDGSGTGAPCGNISSVPHPSHMSFEIEVLVGTEGRMICELLRTYIGVLIGVARTRRAYVSSESRVHPSFRPSWALRCGNYGTECEAHPTTSVRQCAYLRKLWDGWVLALL